MKNLKLTYSPYSLKFKIPFATSKGIIKDRKGFLITLQSNSGFSGIGDSAPFPEFGSESYQDVENQLLNFQLNLKVNLDNISSSVEENLSSITQYPSLRHGIEQALLNLICNEKKITLNSLLNVSSKKEIGVNAVIGFMSKEDLIDKVNNLLAQGFSTIKLKIGRENFKDDFDNIKIIRETAGKDFQIRIDVNGKWTLNEAKDNLKQLEKFEIEYAEQPVSTIEDFIKLSKHTSIPLAADESVRSFNDAIKIIKTKSADVLILKPMMIGGIIPIINIIRLAEINKIKTVITSSFESSVGRSLAIFAASLVEQKTAHGLDTAKYFANDIATNPFPVKNGKINLAND